MVMVMAGVMVIVAIVSKSAAPMIHHWLILEPMIVPENELDDDCDGSLIIRCQRACSPATMICGCRRKNLVEAMDLCQFTNDEEERVGAGVHSPYGSTASGRPDRCKSV